jgi:nitrogen regulatory protein PII 2
MKEIIAVLRLGKDRETKEALGKVGVLTCTSRRVYGRGKQRGLKYTSDMGAQAVVMRYLPKKMIYVVVNDNQCKAVVQTIVRINQTGQFGDGKIFVSDMGEVHRVRTRESGEAAIR